jgi:hypothetical protein
VLEALLPMLAQPGGARRAPVARTSVAST